MKAENTAGHCENGSSQPSAAAWLGVGATIARFTEGFDWDSDVIKPEFLCFIVGIKLLVSEI